MKISDVSPRVSTLKYAGSEETPSECCVGKFRRFLPQILASSAKNLVILNFGLIISFSTILIPALTGLNSKNNPNETLRITPEESTWLASIMAICQPLGSVASGFLTEPIGRRKSLMLVNVPFILGWILIYVANSLNTIYAGFVMLGIGLGLMEAPIFTYIGEICEKEIRGVLTASAGIAATLGISFILLLGVEVSWRTAALICMTVPVSAAIAISFCPESPIWLLSKCREADALKSLQWLRGWTTEDAVRAEFEDLQRCRITAQQCYECEKQNVICTHPPPSISDKIRDLLRRRTIRPFLIVSSQFCLSVFSCTISFRPFLVQVLYFYESPIDPNLAVVWIGWMGIFANISLMSTVRLLGKRKIYLLSMAITILFSFALGAYGFIFLPNDVSSFDIVADTVSHSNVNGSIRYLPLIAFFVLSFITSYGVSAIPNTILCEVFPLKSRAFASGIVTSTFYISMFISGKTFYALETWLTLPGLSLLYGFLGVLGFVGMYLTMPETENRTLEEIELYFSNRKRKFRDIYIPTMSERNLCKETENKMNC